MATTCCSSAWSVASVGTSTYVTCCGADLLGFSPRLLSIAVPLARSTRQTPRDVPASTTPGSDVDGDNASTSSLSSFAATRRHCAPSADIQSPSRSVPASIGVPARITAMSCESSSVAVRPQVVPPSCETYMPPVVPTYSRDGIVRSGTTQVISVSWIPVLMSVHRHAVVSALNTPLEVPAMSVFSFHRHNVRTANPLMAGDATCHPFNGSAAAYTLPELVPTTSCHDGRTITLMADTSPEPCGSSAADVHVAPPPVLM